MKKTTEALTNLFEGHDIRVLEKDSEPWFPLKDLAEAWGLKPNTLYQIVARNEKKFRNRVSDVHVMSTPSEPESWWRSVNEQGLYVLIGAVNTDRLKNPQAADAIDRFQYWVPELIQQYRKRGIVPAQATADIRAELEEARDLAAVCGKPAETFQAAILKKYGKTELATALMTAGEIVHGETGWYNASGLVALCNDPDLTAERLNKFLENYRDPATGKWEPFQYRDGRLWRLTKRGMEHGREYQYNLGNGHSEPRISWRESVLYASGLKKQEDS